MKLNKWYLVFRRVHPTILFVLFLGVLLSGVPAGCDSGATDVGIEGFNSTGAAGTLHTDTLYSDALAHYASFMDSTTTGGADRLYLGSVDNYDFKIVMRFIFPADVESVIVTGAQLKFISTASYGSGGSFTAAIHPIQKDWNVNDLRWTRFDGAADTTVTIAQTLMANTPTTGTVFSFPFPKDTVQHWIYATTDTNRHNYGILIDVPLGAAFAQQFYSGNNKDASGLPDTALVPRLVFTYTSIVDGVVTPGTTSITPVTFGNSGGGNSYVGGSHGYLYRDRSPQPVNTLTVGSGVVYHAVMNFDTGSLPTSATIASAVLIMNIDPTGSYNYSTSTDSIAIQAIRIATMPADWKAAGLTLNGVDYAGLLNSATYRARLTDNIKGTDDTLRLSIGNQLQDWTTRPDLNGGLELFNGNELTGDFQKLYRVKFFNDISNRDRSPKIIVYYTLPPEN